MEFDVAILNKDPDKVESCFYPTFTTANKYQCEQGADYDTNAPFFTAIDYNYRITPMPFVQVGKLRSSVYDTVNFIDALYTLHPKGLEDCIEEFCNKYEHHNNKEIHYIFDHTAIGRNPLLTTYRSAVVKKFEAMGWTVIEHYTHDAPEHDVKHKMLRDTLACRGEHAVMVNEVTCDQMIKSIEMSPAKISGDKTKKDKSTESDEDWPAEDSTHFSDAFDMLLWWLFEYDGINNLNIVSVPMSVL